jgi:thioredoxin-related protein
MKSIIYILIILTSLTAFAQEKINWIEFEDLPSLQAQNPKPIFIYIYADWCVYCKKMERVSFKKQANVNSLNQNYCALKFDIETEKSFKFQGREFFNQETKTQRQPEHDLAKFLTGKQNQISLPAIIILDSDYNILKRLHTYLSPKDFKLLINHY